MKPKCSPNSHAGLAKGRATQQYGRGTMTGTLKAAVDAKANRAIGHTFHSHKGSKASG